MKKKFDIKSPTVHLVMYATLLFATPFILLRNFMQEAIGSLSRFSFYILGLEMPFVVAIGVVVAIALVVALRRYITIYRVLALIAVVLMVALAQKSTDYYFNHKFYDLQHNWHYFAYGIFAYMMYRALKPKKVSASKIILWTFIAALCISSLDEGVQMFMSNRVFDISDIAKDTWGVLAGLVAIHFIGESGSIVRHGWKVRQKRVADYLRQPFSLLVIEIIFAYILLFLSSILSDSQFWYQVIAFTLVAFVIFFIILHLSQKKGFRIAFVGAAAVIIILQSAFFFKYKNENIVYNSYALTVYKGIPIVYYDILIHPNGTFRLVDKKHAFNQRDMQFFHHHASDILLIGSGSEGKGGKGFPEIWETQFVFNPITERGLQIIVQRTPEACETFNRLKNEGKNVLFVIHNTC
ncbi:MAG: VanZ family protein [Victivallales bacterium]|nr:VanZ family protein [Victivallales bacterium]